IPVQLRRKFRIEEGTRLEVIETSEGILFKPKKSFWDLIGSGAPYATVEEVKSELEKLRKEDE
ncbi:MAG: AbrB/MazE/SpoVT family DNA-binding domain-containing protein, partial [Crenarchaeota archaeon]|nr:AbrB/MazE/SpoVT family DNA-binding domain-containing protein [Thermoproteota archaeon]